MASAIYCTFTVPNQTAQYFEIRQKQLNQLWIKFDEGKIDQLVKDGNVVLIDITADWCITCKLNKVLVLDSKDIVNKIKEENVVAMRGDLTIMDDKIMDFMRSHNRYAIPFNIVYGPNAPKGILVSELLNKTKLLEIIDEAKGANKAE